MDVRLTGISSLLFLTAWMTPHHSSPVDFRSSFRPLTIGINKASPAYAALEADRVNVTLQSPDLIDRNLKYLQLKTRPVTHALRLKGLIISSRTPVDHLRELINSSNGATAIAQAQIPTPTQSIVPTVTPSAPPYANMTVQQYAEVLVKRELARRSRLSDGVGKSGTETIESKFGTPIYISDRAYAGGNGVALKAARMKAHPAENPPLYAARSLRVPANSIPAMRRPTSSPPPATASVPAASSTETVADNNAPKISTMSLDALAPHARYLISGDVTMTGGAGVVIGQQQMLIYHETDGMPDSHGAIDLTTGVYHIDTNDLNGAIVAEVRAPSGELIARGQAELKPLRETQLNQSAIQKVNISVTPVFNGIAGSVVSANALGSKKFIIPDARLYVGGLQRRVLYQKSKQMFRDSYVVMPSNFMVEARRDQYWPSIAMAESGDPFQVQLFQNQLIESFLQLTMDKYSARDAENMGVIWGRVTMAGQPIEGASVSLVGERERSPTYFTGFIPDKQRNATSPSGEFAFSALSPVERALQVSLGSKTFWPVLLPVAAKTVTYADLQISSPRKIDFNSFDAFSGKPMQSTVVPLGTSDQFYIPAQGLSHMSVQTIRGLTLLEAQAAPNYATVRSVLANHQIAVSFPFIRNDWLQKMRQKVLAPGQSFINDTAAVFFVSGDDYDVTIGDGAAQPDQNIVYFDKSGNFSARPSADGGFVVFNLPRGFATMTLIPQHSKRVITRLVYVDDYAVATTSINLGF